MTCQACLKPSLRCSICNFYMTIDPPKSAFNGDKGSKHSKKEFKKCIYFKNLTDGNDFTFF